LHCLAIAQVNTIILATHAADPIVLDLLRDRGTKISHKILQLVPINFADKPDGEYDWKWSLGFESRSVHDVAGCLIHPRNPTVSNQVHGKPTYLFSSDVLITLAATIDSQPLQIDAIPEVERSETFPYRHEGKLPFFFVLQILESFIFCPGKACFHVEVLY
jgi:hypothetical protein